MSMTSLPPAKRARANSASDSLVKKESSDPTKEDIQLSLLKSELQTIQSGESNGIVPQGTIFDIVLKAAQGHSDVRAEIARATQAMEETIKHRVLDFDWIAESIWRQMTYTHRRARGEALIDRSYEVAVCVQSKIENIADECENANFQTRRNGLLTLHKIGYMICLSPGTIGRRVTNEFKGYHLLEESMLKLLKKMTDEEILEITNDSGPEALVPKLQELDRIAFGYCDFLFRQIVLVVDYLLHDRNRGDSVKDEALDKQVLVKEEPESY